MLRVVKVNETAVNLDAIASAHWEGDTLYVHLLGGRFLSLSRTTGERIWSCFAEQGVELTPGAGEQMRQVVDDEIIPPGRVGGVEQLGRDLRQLPRVERSGGEIDAVNTSRSGEDPSRVR